MTKEIWSPEKLYQHIQHSGMDIPLYAYVTANFSWKEVLVRQLEWPELTVLENLLKVTQVIQKYRNTVFKNHPVRITSGWRSAKYNKRIGGAQRSYHVKGMALDFQVSGFTPAEVQEILNPMHKGGLEFAQAWTHIDIRPYDIRFR